MHAVRCLWTLVPAALYITAPAGALELPGDIAEVEAGVVLVVTDRARGSGFTVSESGHVVTNWHVVHEATEIYVLEGGSEELRPATLLFQEQERDAAIIRYDTGTATRPLVLRLEPPAKGTPVYSLGYPGAADLGLEAGSQRYGVLLGREASLRDGVVGRVFAGNWGRGGANFPLIQHNAEISGGNSGGPLLDRCGAVLGINTAGSPAELKTDQRGETQIDVNPGIFLASHIGVVLPELERLDIPFVGSATECVLEAGNNHVLYLGLMSVMAAFTGVVAFRRPRERVVRVVAESASIVNESVSRLVGKPMPLSKRALTLRGGSAGAPTFSLGASAFADPKWGEAFGRHPALVDHAIESETVSKRHFRIVRTSNRFYVEDLNSTSGTTLNGRPLRAFELERLQNGDRLAAGELSWTLEI